MPTQTNPPMSPLINDIVSRWTDPDMRPLFKGELISKDGCCCAQGDILRTYCGYSDERLRSTEQSEADKEVADRLGITRFQAVLLRIVNDRSDGCPQDVLTDPEKVIGDQAHVMLAFARHLDRMTPEQWNSAWSAARSAARSAERSAAVSAEWSACSAAESAAVIAARSAARSAAVIAAWSAARSAAYAMNEIQGAAIMRANGTPFYFLPMFGFATPEEVMKADDAHSKH